MRLYHFTTSSFAVCSLALCRLKVGRIHEFNDPYEFLGFTSDCENVNEGIKHYKNQFTKVNGVICFSRSWSNPVMWGHYGDRHKGVVLGFDIADEHTFNVHYIEEPVCIDSFEEFSVISIEENNLATRIVCTKSDKWKYEEEVRAVVILSDLVPENGLYFEPFGDHLLLKEVIMGPQCEIPVEEIKRLLASHSVSVDLFKAELAKSKFVVERLKM